jgi:riboflavin kinase/FMN adenylyltransferase
MNSSNHRAVIAIGNFDGVHKGHAALIAHARAVSDQAGLPLVVLTFEPHPRQYFRPDTPPFRLTSAFMKARRLQALGVDSVEVLAFDDAFAAISAQDFMDDILAARLQAAHIVVGADFHFGHNRTGSVDVLVADGRFHVHPVRLEMVDGAAISSTRIRAALQGADMGLAASMLGWEWVIEGEVVHGDKRGRTLGYPTANIPLGDTLCPAYGIYAVRVDVGDGLMRMGAASLGVRPMFEVKKPLLEVFLLDFTGDLYGRTLSVQLVQKLRDEMKFDDLDALKIQMAKDVVQTRAILSL